ncbi:MAG: carboxylesterase family protein [Halioglobus sp.]
MKTLTPFLIGILGRWCTLLLAIFFVFVAGRASAFESGITVSANGEQLRGESQGSVAIFRGIPFAAPPVGALRWQAPQPVVPRAGVQAANRFAPACMQTSYNTDWYLDIIQAFDGDLALATQPESISEDCLYLNVFSPDLEPDRSLPVMVYMYGGNNLGGWSYEPNYLGHNLAERGVVVVSIAYRLGVFGFFAHPQLTTESGTGSSGNYGLLDQLAALHWVKANVSAFGGDPNNVTVFGESAGAANIGHLTLSPLAKGLFGKVIRQSGAFEINYRDTLVNEEQFGLGFVYELGAKSIAGLRKLPADQILGAAEDYYLASYDNVEKATFYGAVDGYVLPDYVEELYRKGKVNPIHTLLGANADESLMYAPREVSREQLGAYVQKYYQEQAYDAVIKLVADRGSNRQQLAALRAAQEQTCPAQLEADALSRHSIGDVYLYHFTRVRPGIGGQRLGAYHGAELPYVFDTHDAWLSGDEIDVALTDVIMDYWVNFARNGSPNGAGLLAWPRYNASSRLGLELGTTVRVIDAPERALCEQLKPPQP